MTYDLILRGGRVVDPSQKLDAVTDIAFAGGKVARVGAALRPTLSSPRGSSTSTPTSTGAAPRSASTPKIFAAARASPLRSIPAARVPATLQDSANT